MDTEQHLALTAIICGLRRSGIIDKAAVRMIVETLRETASNVSACKPDAATGLNCLANSIAEGPLKSCYGSAKPMLAEMVTA